MAIGMEWLKRHRAWLLSYAAVVTTRLIVIAWLPGGHLYTVDEAEMVLSTLDRFLGVPSTSLAWPGSVLQLLIMPAVAMQLGSHCATIGHVSTLECVATGMGHLYLAPWTTLTLARVNSALVSSAAPLLVFACARTLGANRWPALLGGATLALSPVFWQHSTSATADGVSITLGLAALLMSLRALKAPVRDTAAAGALVGAAIAAKVTILTLGLVSGLVVALTPARSVSMRLRLVGVWCAGTLAGFIALCPYVWTDPLRLLKSILGTPEFSADGGLGQVWTALHQGVGDAIGPVIALAVVGLGALFLSRDRRWLGGATLVGLAVLLAPLISIDGLRASYALPLIALLTVLLGVGATQVLRLQHSVRMPATLGLALFAIPALAFAQSTVGHMAMRESSLTKGLSAMSSRMSRGTMYLPASAYYDALPFLSRETCERLVSHAEERANDAERVVRLMATRGVDPQTTRALMTVFNEDEQALVARLRVMQVAAPESGLDIRFFRDWDAEGSEVRPPTAYVEYTRAEAIELFRRSPGPSALLIDQELVMAQVAADLGDGWLLYVHD